jgi:hypothetical protein
MVCVSRALAAAGRLLIVRATCACIAVREHGLIQFLQIYNNVKHRENDTLKWGDEIEYHLVTFNAAERTVKVPLIAQDVLHALEEEDAVSSDTSVARSAWHPEFGSWMVEGVLWTWRRRTAVRHSVVTLSDVVPWRLAWCAGDSHARHPV